MRGKILNIDCMEYMRGLPDKAFDLAITDPPYFKGVGKLGFYGEKISNTGIKRNDYKAPLWDANIPTEAYRDELVRVSKHQIIWGINYYPWFHSPGRIIWDKKNDRASFSKAEIASCSLHDSVQMFRYLWNGMLQGNMKDKELKHHPTQKPVPLYKWLLDKYAKPGDKILDTHGGSLSLAIACEDMGFDYVITEIDKDYYEAGLKRVNQFLSQPKLFAA